MELGKHDLWMTCYISIARRPAFPYHIFFIQICFLASTMNQPFRAQAHISVKQKRNKFPRNTFMESVAHSPEAQNLI